MEEISEEELLQEPDPRWKGPIRIIVAVFLVLIMVFWTLSYYMIK